LKRQKHVSVYVEGDYEYSYSFGRQKNKPNSNARSDAEWIPAIAGMTNIEYLHGKIF
jgi:hypothetical protein